MNNLFIVSHKLFIFYFLLTTKKITFGFISNLNSNYLNICYV